MKRKLIAALACRNNGSRLYGKPVQNLDVKSKISILDNIIQCLLKVDVIDEIVLGISEGIENEIFKGYAKKYGLQYILGSERDVLSRLILCGEKSLSTDIFRVTSESPFINFAMIEEAWNLQLTSNSDAVFLDDVIDGCGFEVIKLSALIKSHECGDERHRSEMCTLYMRENISEFHIQKLSAPNFLIRRDLRLTVDNPEDLTLCRHVFEHLKHLAPSIPLQNIVSFLDKNPKLIELVSPFVDDGYSSMYL
jgi:spore coat polysaccharide biosynthesis protein SpsF